MNPTDPNDPKGPVRGTENFTLRMREIVRMCGSMAELARRSGVSEAAVRKWKSGESEPTVDRLVKLAQASEVDVGWLASGEGHPKDFRLRENAESYGPTLSADTVELAVTEVAAWIHNNPEFNATPARLGQIVRIVALEIQDRGRDQAEIIVDRLMNLACPDRPRDKPK